MQIFKPSVLPPPDPPLVAVFSPGCRRRVLRRGVVPDAVPVQLAHAIGHHHVALGQLGHGAVLQGVCARLRLRLRLRTTKPKSNGRVSALYVPACRVVFHRATHCFCFRRETKQLSVHVLCARVSTVFGLLVLPPMGVCV